jgi:dTMP kinase
MSGRFITFEGIDGAGKSTQIAVVAESLRAHGHTLVLTREPGGTPLGENVRSLLLDSAHVDSRAELLLVFAARAQHIAEIIRPALDAGHWVISDRFTDASYAYQGGGRGIETSVIGFLEHWVQQELQPDLTLLLDSPLDVGMARARGRGNVDRFESEQEAFFERVRQVYLDRAAAQPQRIKRVDASGSLEDVQVELARHLDQLLESSR